MHPIFLGFLLFYCSNASSTASCIACHCWPSVTLTSGATMSIAIVSIDRRIGSLAQCYIDVRSNNVHRNRLHRQTHRKPAMSV
ncbi:hypothetical protein F5878DRAFT_633872, partial [Lentinula raphanica]